jgi:hypothetical protein
MTTYSSKLLRRKRLEKSVPTILSQSGKKAIRDVIGVLS